MALASRRAVREWNCGDPAGCQGGGQSTCFKRWSLRGRLATKFELGIARSRFPGPGASLEERLLGGLSKQSLGRARRGLSVPWALVVLSKLGR